MIKYVKNNFILNIIFVVILGRDAMRNWQFIDPQVQFLPFSDRFPAFDLSLL